MDNIYNEKRNGLSISIHQDEVYESPEAWVDDGLFLVGYHKDFYVDNSVITKEELIDYANGEEITQTEKYHIFWLEAYIHSSVRLALRKEGPFPDRKWDVSQVGAVLVSKEECPEEADARNGALGLIDTWNNYLSGEVYGYTIENGAGDELESCWGFYGDYEAEALEEARGLVDYMTNNGATDYAGQYLMQI